MRNDESRARRPLDYLGVHFEVAVKAGDPRHAEFGGRHCELQLHTTAQRAWADVSHELLYKPSLRPPTELSRRVYRLMALMEIFDETVIASRDTLRRMKGWTGAEVLVELERLFLELTARDYDRELSVFVLDALIRASGTTDAKEIAERVRSFIATNRDRVETVFEEYADERHPLLFQPEALLVFERLEADPFTLEE